MTSDRLRENLQRWQRQAANASPQHPTPTFQGFQDGELLVSIDGNSPETYGRYMGTGTPPIGTPLPEFRGAGESLLRGIDRPPDPRRRRPIRLAPPLVGEWVVSSHEGTAIVLENDIDTLHFTFNTRPNSTLHSDVQQVLTGGDAVDYNYTSWMRAVDFAFARYLTVAVPTRITIAYTRDLLMPRYEGSEFSSASSALFFRAFMMSATQPPLTSPNDILNDAIARHESGEIFLSNYIENDFVPQQRSQPWNRHWILRSQINSPTFGIDYTAAATGTSDFSEGTSNLTLNLYDPGTYLLLGSLGAQLYATVDYFGGERGDTITDPDNPSGNMIWWWDTDTTITIAPIPPDPPPEP